MESVNRCLAGVVAAAALACGVGEAGSMSLPAGCCLLDRVEEEQAVWVCGEEGREWVRPLPRGTRGAEGSWWCDGERHPAMEQQLGEAVRNRLDRIAARDSRAPLDLGDDSAAAGNHAGSRPRDIVGNREDDHQVEEGVGDDAGGQSFAAFAKQTEEEGREEDEQPHRIPTDHQVGD